MSKDKFACIGQGALGLHAFRKLDTCRWHRTDGSSVGGSLSVAYMGEDHNYQVSSTTRLVVLSILGKSKHLKTCPPADVTLVCCILRDSVAFHLADNMLQERSLGVL